MPFIGNQPALAYTSFSKQDFTTSATTSYTLDNPVANANELALFINFVRQEPTTAYSASGTTLTLTSATGSTDDMYCVFLGKAVQTVNPPNASVGTAQLASDAVTSAKLASDSVTYEKIGYDANPYRNIIINGDMSIDQRNSGSSVTINTTSNIYTLDRWLCSGQVSDGVFTIEQDTDAPTGFTNCSKITVTTADASIGSTQNYLFSQFIEGNNISYLSFGTSDAKTITLSFWVKSSLTGTFGGAINNSDNTRAYPFTYSISSANTWEKKSVTITGDTSGSGTYPTDNNRGMGLRFQIGLGSSQVDTAGAWTATSSIFGATGATNIISTLNATWQITGVQLEAGTSASDFEYLPVDVNLGRCERYFETIADGSQPTYGTVAQICNASAFTTTAAYSAFQYRTIKRTAPSLTVVTGSQFYRFRSGGSNFPCTNSTLGFGTSTNRSGRFDIAISGATVGRGGWITINSEATGFVALDAEL